MNALNFRTLQSSDQDVLWHWLHVALWDPPPAPLRPIEVLQSPPVRIYAESWGKPDDLGVVAQVDGTDVGACWMRTLPVGTGLASVDAATPQLGIALEPGHQRKGIGELLMRETLKRAFAEGIRQVALTVHPQNPARKMYERCGFRAIGLRRGFHLMLATADAANGQGAPIAPPWKTGDSQMTLVVPDLAHLPAYEAALRTGWSSDTIRAAVASKEELQRIAADPQAFVSSLHEPEGGRGVVTLPDGSQVPRLPWLCFWIWDGDFCGMINLRWQKGTAALPSHVLGHAGYAVVPWKQGRGYAASALRQLLPHARHQGLPYIELTTDPANLGSQRVIEKCGGVLVEHFIKPPQYGSKPGLRFRIPV